MTMYPNPRPVQGKPLVSEFAHDPDMQELVGMFVDEMPERVRSLEDLWQARDLGTLTRVAHQLKGASGGYGFTSVGKAAGHLEELLKRTPPDCPPERHLADLRSRVDELIDLCRRVSK